MILLYEQLKLYVQQMETHIEHGPPHLLSVNSLFLSGLATDPDVHDARPTSLKRHLQYVAACDGIHSHVTIM